jgi:hypothetical protein
VWRHIYDRSLLTVRRNMQPVSSSTPKTVISAYNPNICLQTTKQRRQLNWIKTVKDLRFPQGWLWRIPSSEIWRCVDHVWTDVSEEGIASIFSVHKSASEESPWASGCSLQPETSVHTKCTQHYIPEDGIPYGLKQVTKIKMDIRTHDFRYI